MNKNKKIKLEVVVAPSVGRALPAPPVIMASTHTVDYECGHCGVLLMHAELYQVHNLLIHCTKCGGVHRRRHSLVSLSNHRNDGGSSENSREACGTYCVVP